MVTFLIGLLLVVTLLAFLKSRNSRKLPPGPVGLPLFGYYLFLSKNPMKKLTKLAQKFGNVFGLYLGPKYIVVLNNWEAMTEALSQDTTLTRPSSLFEAVPYNFGIVGVNSQEWVHTRRVSSKAIKDVGFNNSGWEDHLQEEALDLVNRISEEGEKAVEVRSFFAESFVNNVVTLIIGERLHAGHPVTRIITKSVDAILEYTPTLGMVNFSPTLSKLLQVLGWEKEDLLAEKVNEFGKFVSETVDERIQKPVASAEDSFIDRYQEEIQNYKKDKRSSYITAMQMQVPTTGFSEIWRLKFGDYLHGFEDSMKGNVIAMLTGGGETTRTTIIWALIAIAEYPGIKRKVHKELDAVIGKEGSIRWRDRSKIPYTYATLLESMRWKTTVPFLTLRIASGDMQIQGYHIPKGTYITSNNWAIHNDPNYWENPEEFSPERFLLDNGTKVNTSPKSFNPFSYGKRNCPGKLLAQTVALLYFVTLMQKFTVKPKAGKKVDHDTLLGLTYQATDVELKFIPR